MKDAIAYILGAFFLAFGGTWLIWPMVLGHTHTNIDVYVGGAAMLLGSACIAPASIEKAVQTFSPVLPWGRRATDRIPPEPPAP